MANHKLQGRPLSLTQLRPAISRARRSSLIGIVVQLVRQGVRHVQSVIRSTRCAIFSRMRRVGEWIFRFALRVFISLVNIT